MKGTPFDFFVQFHLTEKCNLSCRHCYQSATVSEMTYEEICGAITEVRRTVQGWAVDHDIDVSPSLHFTGGEPLVRQDLFSVLGYASGCGFSVSLMTNGTLIDEAAARRIADAKVTDVQISLDGTEAAHDSLRGRGAHRRALDGVRSLVAAGVETNLNVTVTRRNMSQTGELVHVAEELGASGIAFSRLVPSGRGKGLMAEALTRDETGRFYDELRRHRANSRIAVGSRDPLATIADIDVDVPQTELPVGGCAAGVFGVTITADGTIMPCRRMDLPIGNVKIDSLRELWVESPVLVALRTRERYHDTCQSCSYWPVCRGCRAIALAYSRAEGKNDYLGPDPQCPYHSAPGFS
jgi:radical SAM protein with 4Fe4S-binding SPASM domain